MRVRYLPRDLLRRGVHARDTQRRGIFLLLNISREIKVYLAREQIVEENVN